MSLPASLEILRLRGTKVTGAYEEDPHPRVPVTRGEEVRLRPAQGVPPFANSNGSGSLVLLFFAGDVSKMNLPASMIDLWLQETQVTGACKKYPHPRVAVARGKVQFRRARCCDAAVPSRLTPPCHCCVKCVNVSVSLVLDPSLSGGQRQRVVFGYQCQIASSLPSRSVALY